MDRRLPSFAFVFHSNLPKARKKKWIDASDTFSVFPRRARGTSIKVKRVKRVNLPFSIVVIGQKPDAAEASPRSAARDEAASFESLSEPLGAARILASRNRPRAPGTEQGAGRRPCGAVALAPFFEPRGERVFGGQIRLRRVEHGLGRH